MFSTLTNSNPITAVDNCCLENPSSMGASAITNTTTAATMSRSASQAAVERGPLTLNGVLSKIVQNCSNVNNTSEMKIQHLLDVITCLDIAEGWSCDSKWVVGTLAKKLFLIEGLEAIDNSNDEENPLNCIAIDSEIIEVLILTFKAYKSLRKSLEPLLDCIHLLSSSLGFQISYHHLVLIFGVVDQLKKYSLATEERHGALRSYMWSYFNVLCDVLNHNQLSKSKFEIKLEKKVDPIMVKVEGELRTQSGSTFLLLEEIKHSHITTSSSWENTSTLKMILSLKSLLRRNLSKPMNSAEEFHKNSTVIGVSYSKQWIHMFVLRGFLKKESENDISNDISMKLYYKKYRVKSEVDLLILWVDILNFSNIFLSSNNVQSAVSVEDTCPHFYKLDYWKLNPFIDARSDEDDILFKIQNQLKKLCLVPNMVINKKIISEAKNEIGYSCKIQNTTFVKRIEKEEKYIISKILESRNTSRSLPQVMNIYNSFIEYEELLPLPNRLMESDLFNLCLDICNALEFLHSLNIVHRDVKIQNIMLRNPDNNPSLQRYVLIDFSMSFHFEKTDNGYIDSFTRNFANENYGTNSYKAPEVLSGECYNEMIDIFSLGSSILCCLDRKRFVCSKKEDLQKLVDRLEWQNKQFKQVIRMMVNNDPLERPSPRQIQDILNQVVQIAEINNEGITVDGPIETVSLSSSPPKNETEYGTISNLPQEDSIRNMPTATSQQSLMDEAILLRDEEPCKFFTPSKRDSDTEDDDYDSDDSLSPIYSTRTPIVERSDFDF